MQLREFLAQVTAELQAAGCETPWLDARILIAAVLGRDRLFLVQQPSYVLSQHEQAQAKAWIAARAARQPVGRILGWREFWGLRFGLNEATLEPRPDSETIVSAVLELYPHRNQPLRILDLGTGTGCLLLALLHEYPAATGLGVDYSARALTQASQNAQALGLAARVQWQQSDWLAGVTGHYDVIVCNPPYIGLGEKSQLAPEVREHDPALALFAAADGLAVYQHLIPQLRSFLLPAGHVMFEVGAGQAAAVQTLAVAHGWHCRRYRDLGNVERVLVLN